MVGRCFTEFQSASRDEPNYDSKCGSTDRAFELRWNSRLDHSESIEKQGVVAGYLGADQEVIRVW